MDSEISRTGNANALRAKHEATQFYQSCTKGIDLPAALSTLLSRLQVPLVRIAEHDALFGEDETHPAKHLTKAVVQVCCTYPWPSNVIADPLYQNLRFALDQLIHTRQINRRCFTEARKHVLDLIDANQSAPLEKRQKTNNAFPFLFKRVLSDAEHRNKRRAQQEEASNTNTATHGLTDSSVKPTAIQMQNLRFESEVDEMTGIASALPIGSVIRYRDGDTGQTLSCSLLTKDDDQFTFANRLGRPLFKRSVKAFAKDLRLGNARLDNYKPSWMTRLFGRR